MRSYSTTWAGLKAPSNKRTIRYEVVPLLIDMIPFIDVLSLMATGYISTAIYLSLQGPHGSIADVWSDYGRKAVIVATVLAPLFLHQNGTAKAIGGRAGLVTIRTFTAGFLTYVGVVLGTGFATRSLDTLPRGLIALWFAAGFGMAMSVRIALMSLMRRLERQGVLCETIAIIGSGDVADRLIAHLLQIKHKSIHILGVFDDAVGLAEHPGGASSKRSIAELLTLGKERTIDWVLITLPCTAEDRLQPVVHSLKSLAVTVGLCPQNVGLNMPCQTIDYVGDGLPVTIIADRPIKRWRSVVKCAEDMIVGSIITIAVIPVFGLIALAIKLDSPGPIFFKQRRHTSNNVEFNVYKFRTMHWNPAGAGPALRQTAHNDGRITQVGRFLRKSSMDELPQLINVLRGEMSLVGPRAHAVNMRTEKLLGHEIIDTYPHRHRLKAGITGWSQVNGSRGATENVDDLRRRVELDLYYVDNWSLILDVRILVMTLWVVLRGTNAR